MYFIYLIIIHYKNTTDIYINIIKIANTKNMKQSEIIANTSSLLLFLLKKCKYPASPKYKPPDIAAANRNSG